MQNVSTFTEAGVKGFFLEIFDLHFEGGLGAGSRDGAPDYSPPFPNFALSPVAAARWVVHALNEFFLDMKNIEKK